MSDRGDRLPEDVLSVAERLRDESPRLDGLALDEVKTRARARAAARDRAATHGKGALLKSRIAITFVLALGILMSLTGAGLAVSGLGSSGGSAGVQYNSDSTTTTTLVDPNDPGDPGDPGAPGDPGTAASGVQPAAQQSSGNGGGELAFTGFLAIPVLVGGLGLLASGLVLRRRAGAE